MLLWRVIKFTVRNEKKRQLVKCGLEIFDYFNEIENARKICDAIFNNFFKILFFRDFIEFLEAIEIIVSRNNFVLLRIYSIKFCCVRYF